MKQSIQGKAQVIANKTQTGKNSRHSRRRARTQQKLFDAGFRLFESHAVSQVSVAQISETADLGSATFYTHFASKEKFVEALAVHALSVERDRIKEKIGDIEDPVLKLAILVQMTVESADTNSVWRWFFQAVPNQRTIVSSVLGRHAMRDVDCLRGRIPKPGYSRRVTLISTCGIILSIISARVEGHLKKSAGTYAAEQLLRSLGLPQQDIEDALVQLAQYLSSEKSK